jgi:hypothetical protein
VVATNLTATFLLAQASMRPMLKQRGGRIIVSARSSGRWATRAGPNYAASKAGLDRLCQGAGTGSGVARHHRERRGARPGRDRHDARHQGGHESRLGHADSARPPRPRRTMWRRRSASLRQTRQRILQGTCSPSTAGCTCRRIEWP